MHITSETKTLTFETTIFKTPQNPKCIYVILFFKSSGDCDAMMHVLKDSINLK